VAGLQDVGKALLPAILPFCNPEVAARRLAGR
jgi:hypothetical protein